MYMKYIKIAQKGSENQDELEVKIKVRLRLRLRTGNGGNRFLDWKLMGEYRKD